MPVVASLVLFDTCWRTDWRCLIFGMGALEKKLHQQTHQLDWSNGSSDGL